MTFEFVLIDLTTVATPAGMRPSPYFDRFIEAWEEQVDGPFSEHWGCPIVSFRVGKSPEDRATGEIAIHFRDVIPEAPGALAYHTITAGVPDIEMGVDLFETPFVGQESMCCGGSHEVLELILNPGANGWKEKLDGSQEMNAEEACDFVQNTSYTASNGGTVSNFVTPPFFLPGSEGPWDYLDVMTSQDDVSHGYGDIADAPGRTSQIGGTLAAMAAMAPGRGFVCPTVRRIGTLTPLQSRRKSHPFSRGSRRRALPPPPPAPLPA